MPFSVGKGALSGAMVKTFSSLCSKCSGYKNILARIPAILYKETTVVPSFLFLHAKSL